MKDGEGMLLQSLSPFPDFSFRPVSVTVCTGLTLFLAFLFMELSIEKYTPENDRDIFSLLLVTSSSSPPIIIKPESGNASSRSNGRLLFCSMISSNFFQHAAGAAKLAKAFQKDSPLLFAKLNLQVEAALLEVAESPVPPKIWQTLKESGWQRKITRPLAAVMPAHAKQLQKNSMGWAKLHLWSLEEYDWILYVDSDVLLLRSMVPCITAVLQQQVQQHNNSNNDSSSSISIAAIRDIASFPDAFSTAVMMIQPSMQEFNSLLCKSASHPVVNCTRAIPYAEAWAEQGFLNAAYLENWTEIPATCGMDLALWQQPWLESVWRPNATSIRAIHFTVAKPWDWFCAWTQYAPMCYLFWNERSMRFHAVHSKL